MNNVVICIPQQNGSPSRHHKKNIVTAMMMTHNRGSQARIGHHGIGELVYSLPLPDGRRGKYRNGKIRGLGDKLQTWINRERWFVNHWEAMVKLIIGSMNMRSQNIAGVSISFHSIHEIYNLLISTLSIWMSINMSNLIFLTK